MGLAALPSTGNRERGTEAASLQLAACSLGSPFPVPGSRDAWSERSNALYHRPDVIRRRPTTPAHDLRAGVNQVTGVRRHVLRARHVHAAAADVARHAGVRLGAELLRRHGRHLLDGLEDRLRADRAVEADDIDLEL